MIAEFIGVDGPRWREVLRRLPHDVYHLPEYGSVAARYEGGTAVAFHVIDGACELLMPILIRPLPPTLGAPSEWKDAASPYGYSGPIASGQCDIHRIRGFIKAFEARAAEHNIVAAFLRLHPLRGIPIEAFEPDRCVRHGSIVFIDLTRPLHELQAETRRDHRQGIRRLSQAGFVATMDDWTTYDGFKKAYRSTMDRVSAAEFYNFSDAYFDDIRQSLGDHLHLCSVRAPNGDVACAGLFTTVEGTVQYHLSGTDLAYLRWAPSKLMVDAARTWASQRGDRIMILGGAPDSDGSLMMFKAGFSPSRAAFHTARIVVHEDRYARLLASARDRRDLDDSKGGFFPAYRRPLATHGGDGWVS